MSKTEGVVYQIVEASFPSTYTAPYTVSDGSKVYGVEVWAEPHRSTTVSIDGVEEDSPAQAAIESLVLADYWGVADQIDGRAGS